MQINSMNPSLRDIAQVLFNVEQTHKPIDLIRNEYRYLITNPDLQSPVLASWASVQNTYRTKTIYVDTREGTWSVGKSQTKMRLRNYNGERTWWIEIKSNLSGQTDKHRRMLFPEDIVTLNTLVPVALVTYRRREYESPSTSPGLRVTIDTDLLCWKLPDNLSLKEALYAQGQPIAKMNSLVLETKGPENFPKWLPLPAQWPGSKSRWTLAALAGHPNTIGPSITNADLSGVPV